MRARGFAAGFFLMAGTSAFACSVLSGDTQGVIDQVVLFTTAVWSVGVLATLGYWFMGRPPQGSMAIPAGSCLLPVAVNLILPNYTADCGVSGAAVTVLWLFVHVSFLSWRIFRTKGGGEGAVG